MRSGKPVRGSVSDTRDPADAAFLRVVRRDAGPNCSRRTGTTERLRFCQPDVHRTIEFDGNNLMRSIKVAGVTWRR